MPGCVRIAKTAIAPLRYTTFNGGWPVRSVLLIGGPMFEGLFQPMHLLVIFFIALLVFGPRKLPELGKGLGEGIRALKEGMKDHSNDPKVEAKPEAKPVITPENNPENKA